MKKQEVAGRLRALSTPESDGPVIHTTAVLSMMKSGDDAPRVFVDDHSSYATYHPSNLKPTSVGSIKALFHIFP